MQFSFAKIVVVVKNKKLLIVLLAILFIAITMSFLLLRNNDPKLLMPGDKDPLTGCTVAENNSAICPESN